MSEHRDPPRWLSAAPADIAQAFTHAAREHEGYRPQAEQRARMWQQVEREFQPTLTTRSRRLSWAGAGLGALLLVGAGAAWNLWPKPPSFDAPPQAAGVHTPVRRPPAAAEPPPPPAENLRIPASPPVAATTEPPQAASVDANGVLRGDRVATRNRASSSLASPTIPSARPPTHASSLASTGELQLLVRARRLVRTAPDRALELTERHRSKFSRGMFVEERELLAIEALSGAGRQGLAAARAHSFLATFPSSAHRRRVELLVGRE